MIRISASLAVVALLAVPAMAAAEGADPAIAPIEALDSALLGSMKAGKDVGAQARYSRLLPTVERSFDLAAMTRFAVGSAWTGYSATDQTALVKAFSRLTVANFARNFDSYDGEQFRINPAVQTRGLDKLVRTQLVPKSGEPTDLNYRMRQSGGSWKVIDVYFGAVSELTAQRSDFAATVSAGGAEALIQKMNLQADKLLKSAL